MVGDPSGRSEERNLLTRDELEHNVQSISQQLEGILDFSGPNPATMVNNADWTVQMPLLDFLRDIGKHVSVPQMLGKDSVKSRLSAESGLSFTEFSYMLLQANDFRHLHASTMLNCRWVVATSGATSRQALTLFDALQAPRRLG